MINFLKEDWRDNPYIPRGTMNNEWKVIDKLEECPRLPVLICDHSGFIYVADTSFDYYDADYWFPIPYFPEENCVITNDRWLYLATKNGMIEG